MRSRLGLLGPAFVAAIAYIDPGNYATNIEAGAKYGYTLLWVVFWANLMAVLIQLLSSKLGLATRSSLAAVIRDHLPPWATCLYWVQAEILAIATDLAEFVGASLGFHLLLGMSLLQGALCTAAVSWLILALERRGLEPLELVIAGMLGAVAVSYVAELLFSHPEPRAVVAGMMIPRFTDAHAVYLAAGILGATVMPHVIYLHSALSRADLEHHPTAPLRRLFRASCLDVGLAMALASFVNLAMLAMAAAVFHGTHHQEVADIATAYRTLEPLLGPWATHFFGASLIVAGVSSSVVGTLAGQEVMQDFMRFRIPLWLRRIVTMTPSLVVILLGVDAGEILVLSQVVLSFGIALALVPLILFTSRRALMGDLANSLGLTGLAWGVAALVLALNVYLLTAIDG